MQYSTSQVSRRIVGRFDKGDRLPDALVDLCRREAIDAGRVRAAGVLSQVDLALFSVDEAEYRGALDARGAFELLSFDASLSLLGPELLVNAHAVVAFDVHGHGQVVGGQLRSGVVHAVEFVIDVFEDVAMTRSLDPATQLPLLQTASREVEGAAVETAPSAPAPVTSRPAAEPSPPELRPPEPKPPEPIPWREPTPQRATITERPSSPTASQDDWAKAARKSQEILSDAEDDLDWVELETGDILMHPRLGECIVMKVEDDAAYIRIKSSRRISKLALGLVRLEEIDERDGKRVFSVEAGSR